MRESTSGKKLREAAAVGRAWERGGEKMTRLDIFDDKVVHHAVEINEEENHEVDQLGKRDVLVELKLGKYLSGINTILLGVEDVTIPASKRKIECKLDPETTKKENNSDGSKGDHLIRNERIQTLCKIYRIQINIKITE